MSSIFSEKCPLVIQTAGGPSLGKDEAELPSVQGGNLHGASQPTGGSPAERSAGKQGTTDPIEATNIFPTLFARMPN